MAKKLTDADVGKHFIDLTRLVDQKELKPSDVCTRLRLFIETFGVQTIKDNVISSVGVVTTSSSA